MHNNNRIIFDAERMKHPYTGLFYYCKFLGRHILEETKKDVFDLGFYLPHNASKSFGEDVYQIEQHPLHKFFLPLKKECALWHNTYQNSSYFPSKKSIPILLTIHDLNFMYDEKKSAAKKNKYLKAVQQNIDRSEHVVAISNSTLQDVKKHLNTHNKATSVIYNGCSIDEISVLSEPQHKPQTPFLFTIGTVVNKKNFHVLPALLKNKNWQLVIAGTIASNDYKNMIIAEAIKHNVQNQVVFVGSISENDKQWYYKHCLSFVFPSISEGFGLPVIEAMHFGKPVVLSKLTCLPEIGGTEAYYFDSFEPSVMQANLESALHHYQNNPSQKESIKKRAGFFSWKNAAKDFVEVYKTILSR
jgi:glycosyltransferase involved in cell wall biosynthesis